MDGLPVVIRLLDPPLHEFLPAYEELLVEVMELRNSGDDSRRVRRKRVAVCQRVASMREANPMLGMRGCRLGLLVPGVNAMQVKAILLAEADVEREGKHVLPEIMIPLVGHVERAKGGPARAGEGGCPGRTRRRTRFTLQVRYDDRGSRAALTAEEIAEHAEFFSFGTNDLTQTTFAISRDDGRGQVLLEYVQRNILPANPFQVLDQIGVGSLMRIAVEHGRRTRPDIELGICGEHGGEPSSIEFCHNLGLDYVSCSPYRAPVARLAAAQAALAAHDKDF